MEPWGVLVWNMGRGAKKRGTAAAAWAFISELTARHNVCVALLNEADVYSLRSLNTEATRDGEPKPAAFSNEGTQGQNYWEKNGVRTPYDRSGWSAAVVSTSGAEPLGEQDVRAVSPSWPHRSPDIDFTNSRPGSWVAARVPVGPEMITCVSLYGLMDELSDASMHRSLSEVSPVFSDPRHKEFVLLGGDFNTSTATSGEHRERDRIVLDRIKAYGLRDCLAEWRENNDLPALVGCPCDDCDHEPCRHTLTRLTPNEKGEKRPWQERVAKQVDYLFASDALADRLDDIVDVEPEVWETFSDHRPIIVKFRAED